MNIIVIEKDGNLFEKNVKSIDKLYSICGYRSNKDFEKLYEWEFDKNIYELYGKKNGKQDKENNYEFPNINERYYGTLSIVKKNGSLTIDEWNIFYMSFSSIFINSCNESNESDEESHHAESDMKNKIQYDEELNYEEYEEE